MEAASKKTGLIVSPIDTKILKQLKSSLLLNENHITVALNTITKPKIDESELYGTIEHFTSSEITILARKEDNLYKCKYNTSLLKIEVGDAIAVKIKEILPLKESKEESIYNITSRPLIIISSKEENILALFTRVLNDRSKSRKLMVNLLEEYDTKDKVIEVLSLFATKWWDSPKLPSISKKQSIGILKEWNTSRNYRQLYLFGLKWDDIRVYTKYAECDILQLAKVCLIEPSHLFMLEYDDVKKIGELTNTKIDKTLHTFTQLIYEETLNGKMYITSDILSPEQKITLNNFPIKQIRNDVYLNYPFTVQSQLASHIRKLLRNNNSDKFDLSPLIINPILSSQQKDLLKRALNSALLLITGPAGTGKSLLIKEIYQNFEANNVSIILGCPTGMAAANLRKILKSSAPRTLHYFLRKEIIPKVLLIDEVSMLTPELLLLILDKFPSISQLIMVGDPYQLPPVEGFGSILAALYPLQCSVKLTETFRFGDQLLKSSMDILEGKVPEDNECFQSIPGKQDDVIEAYDSFLNNKIPLDEILILSPFKKAVQSINETIQKLLEERKKRKRKTKDCEGNTWIVGDKVIFLENNPDCDVYNGQIGTIIDANKDLVTVEFEDTIVSLKTRYDKRKIKKKYSDDSYEEGYTKLDDLGTFIINLAYAVTIHKAQGSQAPLVLIFLPWCRREGFINKKLIYTGTTRAQSSVLLIGDMGTFEMGCKTDHELYPIKLGDP